MKIHKYNRFIAIDPGSNGEMAIWKANTWVVTQKIPDPKGLLQLFSEDPEGTGVCIEQSHLFKTSNKAIMLRMQSLIRHQNSLVTVAKSLDMDLETPHPKTWQADLGLNVDYYEKDTDRKNRYKQFAAKHFPYIRVTLANADALLLLIWVYNKKLGKL